MGDDVERREALKLEYKLYKDKERNAREDELGFAVDGVRTKEEDGTLVRNELIEHEKPTYEKKLMSAQGQHILLADTQHIDVEEKQVLNQKQTRRSRIKNKLATLMSRKKASETSETSK